jgi:anti-sigma regulatory factor (Ser/Thr protein kinase)
MATLTVPNRPEFVRPATTFVVQAARAFGIPAASDSVFEVAISEAITNAVKHGGDPALPDATVTCELQLDDRTLTIRIIDDGEGFELPPMELPDITADRIDSVPSSGYGLPIIHTVFPDVRVIEVHGRFGLELGLRY